MRDQLMPLLTDMYGEGFLHHLSRLSEESSQLRQIVNQTTFSGFYKTVQILPVCVTMDFGHHLDLPTLFYMESLRTVCHKCLGVGMVREKSVTSILMPRLQAINRADAHRR
jgi:hypothetical protein